MGRKRFKNSVRLSAGVVGFMVSVAAAFFFASFVADGTGEGKTGKGTTTNLTAVVTVPDGLTPTAPVALKVDVNNTTGKRVTFTKLKMTIATPSVPICGENWLELKPEGGNAAGYWQEKLEGSSTEPIYIEPGTQSLFSDTAFKTEMKLRFKPGLVESTNQTSCENTTVKVTAHLE